MCTCTRAVCVCMHVCVHMCSVHIVHTRGQLGYYSSGTILLVYFLILFLFESEFLTGVWDSLISLACLGKSLSASPVLDGMHEPFQSAFYTDPEDGSQVLMPVHQASYRLKNLPNLISFAVLFFKFSYIRQVCTCNYTVYFEQNTATPPILLTSPSWLSPLSLVLWIPLDNYTHDFMYL